MSIPRQRKFKRTGILAVPREPELPLAIRRQLLADFCKIVAARQDVAHRSTKVDADLSLGEPEQFDANAIRPRRRTALPFHGTVAASFVPDVVDVRRTMGERDEPPTIAHASADHAAPAGQGRIGSTLADDDGKALSPRLLQTLDGLLRGDSEKQIALKLAISKHTVHAYVKMLYRRYGANSRGELLARWVRR